MVWVERALAKRHCDMAECLSSLDPRSDAMTFEVADGFVAFFGPGMFVNHAMAVGLERPVETSHLRLLERRATEVGVDAAIETIDGLASASLTDLLCERGYVSAGKTSVLVLPAET